MKKQLKVSLIGNIPIVLICFLLVSSLSVLSNALYDFNMRNSMSQEYHQDIVVVGIDDKSLKENGAWPWDRSKYIPLIENLENAGAKVIAFDVMFNEAGANAESDKKLAETLGKYKNIIFPAQAVFEGGSYDFDNTSTAYHPKNGPIEAKGLTSSLELFGKVTQTAHINADLDKDGVIRNTFLQVKVPNSAAPLPSMAVKAAEIAGVDVNSQLDKYPNKEMAIRYDLLFSDFQTIPFVDVVNKAP
ncbi:MAG: CHASE2 domain-containing protein, partial [Paenibacillaceae bacterium]|nr:CHASE2 domain-containing protein [Paenibacillaceae bacterium]